jgi:hypothetical protein
MRLDMSSDTISLILPALMILLIFVLCGWVIKRRMIDKKWPSPGAQFISRIIYSQYETQEHREATKEMDFTEEDEKDEDRGGEGPAPGKNEGKAPDDAEQ